MVSSPLGLQTSGRELREMLQKSGARHNTTGAEKLDFLFWLADQVKGSIEERRRMHLTVSDLCSFLRKEQLHNLETNAKGAVGGLLALRRRELERLSYGSDRAKDAEAGDACFELALLEMPTQDVERCFTGGEEPAPALSEDKCINDPKNWTGPKDQQPDQDIGSTKHDMSFQTQTFFIGGDDLDDAEDEFFSGTTPSHERGAIPLACRPSDDENFAPVD